MNLKSSVLAFIALCSVSFMSCSDDDKISDIPSEVEMAFAQKYPNVPIEEYKETKGYSVIDFHLDGMESEAWFNTQGWIMTEIDIAFNSLPKAVISSFNGTEFASWKIDDVDMVERLNFETVYVIEVEQGDVEMNLYFTEAGILVKAEIDRDDDDYLPEQISSEILAIIKDMYPDAIFVESEIEDGNLKIDIIIKDTGKEMVFSKTNEWLYTKWDIVPSSLPDNIKAYLAQNYADYRIDDVEVYETPKGTFFEIELEQGNKEIEIRITESLEIIK